MRQIQKAAGSNGRLNALPFRAQGPSICPSLASGKGHEKPIAQCRAALKKIAITLRYSLEIMSRNEGAANQTQEASSTRALFGTTKSRGNFSAFKRLPGHFPVNFQPQT